MNIFATAHWNGRMWFAQPRAGHSWAIDNKQAKEFALHEGKEIWIRCDSQQDQFCRVMSEQRSVA